VIESVHVVFDPEHAPPQLLKLVPVPGVAVKVTEVPCVKEVSQVAPQLMPDGVEPTEPEPVTITLNA